MPGMASPLLLDTLSSDHDINNQPLEKDDSSFAIFVRRDPQSRQVLSFLSGEWVRGGKGTRVLSLPLLRHQDVPLPFSDFPHDTRSPNPPLSPILAPSSAPLLSSPPKENREGISKAISVDLKVHFAVTIQESEGGCSFFFLFFSFFFFFQICSLVLLY